MRFFCKPVNCVESIFSGLFDVRMAVFNPTGFPMLTQVSWREYV